MADPHHCSVEASKILKDMSPAEIDKLRMEIERRQRESLTRNAGESAEAALFNAANEIVAEKKIESVIAKRNALLNLTRRIELVDFVTREFSADLATGIEAVTVGVNRANKKSRLSAASEQRGLQSHYVGGLIADMMRANLFKEFVKGVYDRDVARAMFRMGDQQDPLDGLPKEAVQIARVIHKWQNIARDDANRAGAYIGNIKGYITRQSHDMFRIRDASKSIGSNASNDVAVNYRAWRNFIFPLLDQEKTFKGLSDSSPEGIEKFLRQAYEALWSGVHLTNAAPNESASIPSGLESIAKRMSQERLLHFKDGEAWFNYNEKFGVGGLNETVIRGLELSGNQTGLMRVFGPNARMTFDALFESAMRVAKKQGPQAARILREQAARLDNLFKEIDGSTRIPENEILARRAGVVRAFQSMSKLGMALLSAVSDIPFFASELRFQGVGFLEAYRTALTSVLRGRGGADGQELMSMLGVAMDTFRGDVVARFHAEDTMPGWTSSMMAKFFKLNGLSIWTDGLRKGAAEAMSRRLAMNRNVAWGSLNKDLQRTLGFYGISEKQWDVIRAANAKDIGGESFVVPEAIRGVDDALIDPLIQDKINDLHARTQALTDKLDEADMRDAAFVAKRRVALNTRLDEAAITMKEIRKEVKGRKDAVAQEVADRIERIEAEMERAAVVSDIEAFLTTERTRGRTLDLLERVEEGADVSGAEVDTADPFIGDNRGPSIGDLAARSLDEFSRVRGNQAEKLGARLARAERRISDARVKQKKVSETASESGDARVQAIIDRGIKWEKEFQKFSADAFERQVARKERIKARHEIADKRLKRLRDDARLEIERALRSYFVDRTDYAVVNPDAKTNAFMNRGTQRGTVEGEFFRFLFQFKSFPIAVLQRPIGRELFARGTTQTRAGLMTDLGRALANGEGELQGLAHLFIVTTAMGYIAMSAKDLAKGRTPRPPNEKKTWIAAMAQGGGLGIYGDFLFGEMKNRYGQNALSTLAGPTFGGSVTDVFDLWGRFRDGDDFAATLFSDMVNHVPFANLFYTRMAMDYLILHRIREGMNPGYLARMERRIERENAQRFLLPPSSVIPRGGGIVGQASAEVADVLNATSGGGLDATP